MTDNEPLDAPWSDDNGDEVERGAPDEPPYRIYRQAHPIEQPRLAFVVLVTAVVVGLVIWVALVWTLIALAEAQ